MGTGYTRNDTGNNIADGNIINAADLDGEFDALQAAFNASTGHTHDGTSEEGAPITTLGPSQDVNISVNNVTPKTDNTVDLGSASFEFKDLYLDGTANIDSLVADTADINGGTIDNAIIGGSTPAAGTFTTLAVNGNTTLGDADTDTVTFTADVASNLIPSADDTYDLGASGSEWKDLYVDGTANIDSLVADTADINGGTIDNAVIGGGTAAAGTFTTVTATTGNITTANATTVDTTNIEVTNIKAKDGTAAVTIADSTGVVTVASSVLTTTDINGGTIDNATIGAGTPAAATVTDLTVNGNATLGDAATDTVTFNADVASNLIPSADDTYDLGEPGSEWKDLYVDGTANIDSLVADTADINGGTIDNAIIGGGTAAAGTFTTATATTGNITTVNATTVDTTNIEVTNLKAKDGTAAGSIADSTGVVTLASSVLTTTDINGGTIDNAAIGANTASTGAFTTLAASSTTTLNGTTIPASKTLVVTTDIGVSVQAYDAQLADVAGLTPTDGNFIVGDGTNFITEDGATARASLGLGSIATQAANSVDIDGGAVDGITLGTNSAVTEAQIDNINVNGNTISSTNTDGNIAITPNGTGEVDITKVDIDSGAIDGVTLGTNSPVTEAQIDNVNINGNTISSTDTNGDLTLAPDGTGGLIVSGTNSITVPNGTTAQRDGTPASGMLRFNSNTNEFEGYDGTAWGEIGGGSTISNDTSTASDLFPIYVDATTGTAADVYTSNAQYLFKPSTGELKVKAPVASNGILVNADEMTSNYTIDSGTNGLSVGPFTISGGVSLTIAAGQRHLIL
jgi:hypothetical protein